MMILSTPGHLFLVVLFLWENAKTDVDVCQTVFPFFMVRHLQITDARCTFSVQIACLNQGLVFFNVSIVESVPWPCTK